MRKEYSAMDIANWFIYKTNAEKKENQVINDEFEVYESLTHLKLQKLLYFAQGISLSILNKPLFKDTFLAWEHGPVIKKVWNYFSEKGRNEITIKDIPNSENIVRTIELDDNVRKILNMTYDNFAIYTAWQLRNMTHIADGPWDSVYEVGKNKEISNKIIKEYFDKYIME